MTFTPRLTIKQVIAGVRAAEGGGGGGHRYRREEYLLREIPAWQRVWVLSLLGLQLQQSWLQLKEQSRFGFDFEFDCEFDFGFGTCATSCVPARLLQLGASSCPGPQAGFHFRFGLRSQNKLTMASSFFRLDKSTCLLSATASLRCDSGLGFGFRFGC